MAGFGRCGFLRGGFWGAGAFASAQPQRLHQVHDLVLRLRLEGGDLPALDLRLHHLGKRGIVAIVECRGGETAAFGVDDMPGKVEHLALQFDVGNAGKSLPGGADLVIVVERGCDDADALRADEQRAHAPEENGLGQRGDLQAFHALADQGESLLAGPVRRGEVVGLVEKEVVDLFDGDEGLDVERLVALRQGGCNLLRGEDDIVLAAGLVALHLVVALHQPAGFAVHEFPVQPVPRRAVEHVKGNALARRGRRVERDGAGQFADLQEAFPVRSRRHASHSRSKRRQCARALIVPLRSHVGRPRAWCRVIVARRFL